MNLRSTFRFLGRLLLVLAAAQVVPVLCSLAYQETLPALAFLATAAITGCSGLVLLWSGRGGGETYRREGILIVVGGWVLASVFGALPYLLTGTVASPVDALFESASGFTTTGASILTDIESSGRGILMWRSFTQWLGGMGIIVLFVALLPELGAGARFLYRLEVPGPTAETLHPRVHDTASILWRIYLAFSALLVVFLMLAGMDLYDALTHAFSTLSTGGFSPRNTSVAAFESAWIEAILVVFMIIAGANFSLYFGLRRRHGLRDLLADRELRIYLSVFLLFSLVVAAQLVFSGITLHPGEAFLDASFQVASLLTTTGFATEDFDLWPNFSRLLLVLLLFSGACAGSTSGGPKVMRLVIAFKAAVREIRLIFSPNTVIAVSVGKSPVPDPVVRSVVGFLVLYAVAYVGGVLCLAWGDLDLLSAATASIATLGNIGPGLIEVGPTRNFAFFGDFQKLVMVLLMWLGRLEVYAIAALFTRAYWRG